jgi:hypothetical protein
LPMPRPRRRRLSGCSDPPSIAQSACGWGTGIAASQGRRPPTPTPSARTLLLPSGRSGRRWPRLTGSGTR